MRHLIHISLALLVMTACQNNANKNTEEQAEEPQAVTLTQAQTAQLKISVGGPVSHDFTGAIEANGQLQAPPQGLAAVTPKIGATVQQILVEQGQTVRRGQTVALLSHPDLTDLQSRYLTAVNRRRYLQKECQRQELMMREKVGVGKDLDRARADLQAANSEVRMFQSQLLQLGIAPAAVAQGKVVTTIPLKSPISGTVEQVSVETGQYAGPETVVMRIVNTSSIYADLLVYQRDVSKVRKGQTVMLQTENSAPVRGRVSAVGSTFAEDAKAVHVLVKIDGELRPLITGMYVQGRIAADSERLSAVPSAAVVDDGNKSYVFTAVRQGEKWTFRPVEVQREREEDGWVVISSISRRASIRSIALAGAYYLLSELKKGETGEE